MLAVIVFFVDPVFLCYCSSKSGIKYRNNQHRKRERNKERKEEKQEISTKNSFHDAVSFDQFTIAANIEKPTRFGPSTRNKRSSFFLEN
jgi:hypothetical protein